VAVAEPAGRADAGALPAPKRRRRRDVNLGDRVFRAVAGTLAASVVAVLLFMAVQIGVLATPAMRRFGFRFLIDTTWDPVAERFGALPFVYGTVVSSLLALVLAVPIAIGIAIFLTQLAPAWLRAPVGFAVELLAAVPSVVYGLWGVFVLAPWLRGSVEPGLEKHLGFLPLFRGPSQGVGMLAAALVLAIMILPTIASVSREVLRAVPPHLYEGGLALGARRWDVLRRVILPYARSGLVGAVMLGLGRALGETMAVTMVIGNRPEISASLLSPSYTMASVIANEFTEATGEVYLAALAEVGLLLFLVTLVLNVAARLLVMRSGKAAEAS
jgi:phosphate transport system permease protein